jgi:hypothetical protein
MIHSRTHSPNPYIELRTEDQIVLVVPKVHMLSESNTRGYWTKHFKRHQAQRSEFNLIVSALVKGVDYPVRVDLTYHSVGRMMDQGNIGAAFKHIQDGIADAIGVDDGDRKFWDWHYDEINDAPKGHVYVVVTFTRRSLENEHKENQSLDAQRKARTRR